MGTSVNRLMIAFVGLVLDMKPPELFETERLQLRPPAVSDAEAIFQGYAQDAVVSRYMTWHPHTAIQETEAYLQRCLTAWSKRSAFTWVLIHKLDQRLMGMMELRIETHKAEIGYVLAQPYWGQGYMPEAVQALISWALQHPQLYRVWAVCDTENRASSRVMEKVGMQREGILRRWTYHPNVSAEPRDVYCYAIVK